AVRLAFSSASAPLASSQSLFFSLRIGILPPATYKSIAPRLTPSLLHTSQAKSIHSCMRCLVLAALHCLCMDIHSRLRPLRLLACPHSSVSACLSRYVCSPYRCAMLC